MFKKVEPQLNLPKLEEEILKFWDENKIFEKSLEIRKDAPQYSFYDGPPFATGTPHYGHILTGVMKDVVPRYYTMKGKLVERKWGWDCHGLPIENIAEKELGIKNKKQIEEMGVDKFNEVCRSKILSYVPEWKKVIRRLGRWVDMENAYMTMDLSYMESVWWVFKQLWDKKLIYEGYRSMHICPRCETTLSQFEVAEGYKDIKDLSVIAKFELVDEPGTYFLAWTTTPWTLLGNVALAVGADIKYVKVTVISHSELDSESQKMLKQVQHDNFYILAKDRLQDIFKDKEYTIVEEFSGKDLVGKKYKPLFDVDKSIENSENGWKVVAAPFVTTEEGTGVVHIAPAFGEDDMNLGKELELPFIQHIGMDGIIKSGYGEFTGLSVKPSGDVKATDKKIVDYLEKNNTLFSSEEYEHSYPHCWRCDTPLLNYATSSWFVAVEKVKLEALKLAKDINWSPKHIKAGRFGMWLKGARDWSISRQRYWASVLPIWKCTGEAEVKSQKSKVKSVSENPKFCDNIVVIGSVKELEELSNQKVTDLHKHIVDKIEFDCSACDGKMKRIPDVLDTWFDSGSMPYAQMHYPFENKQKFESNFPAEFIAEGVDQTRAWFYYLHILGAAVMQKPAYKNVIVNGIVLAEDGKKMSKRLKNYPDPMEVFNKYGADVLRLYLLSSPVMSAENLSLKESELVKLQRGFFRMLWNCYYFFVLYADVDKWKKSTVKINPENILDRWILAKVEKLNLEVEKSMRTYNLAAATRQFMPLVDDLSNWYIRRSRKRFWKPARNAFSIADAGGSESDSDKESAYQTLYYVLIKLSKLLAPFVPFIADEIYKNLTGEESVHLTDYPEADKSQIDEGVIEEMSRVRKIVELGLAKRAEAGIKVRQPLASISYHGEKISNELEQIIAEEVNIKLVKRSDGKDEEVELDSKLTSELIDEGFAREFVRMVQSLRKKADFQIDDRIDLFWDSNNEKTKSAIESFKVYISKETLAVSVLNEKNENLEFSKIEKINSADVWIGVRKSSG